MENERTTNGIMYTEEIISIYGASFMLFPTADDTPEMIAEAKNEIKQDRDVVSLSVATQKDWDELYRGEVFKHPLTRHLKWYEINAYLEIIREERLKGTTIEDYIKRLVLPCVAETRSRNLQKYGDKIFEL
jgi:hypothetical protein